MKSAISQEAIKQLFTEARSHHAWQDRAVSSDLLKQIYELTKWGPTAVNAAPMRIVYLTTNEAKKKILPSLMGSNVEQVKAAPVTAIIAQDTQFYDFLPQLFPAFDARSMFVNNSSMSESTAFRNSSLQGAYFIMAARALGLDVCPMSGFDNGGVDKTFFEGTTWKSNFIITLGYGIEEKLYPRGPRLTFNEAAKIL